MGKELLQSHISSTFTGIKSRPSRFKKVGKNSRYYFTLTQIKVGLLLYSISWSFKRHFEFCNTLVNSFVSLMDQLYHSPHPWPVCHCILACILCIVHFLYCRSLSGRVFQFCKWSKVIHPKYSKHWLSTVAHTIDCVCRKILNHGLLF